MAKPTEPAPLKRTAPDGQIYQRIAKKQYIAFGYPNVIRDHADPHHWCSESPEPITDATPPHVCDIWELAASQEPAPPALEPEPAARELTTDELIRRVSFSEEQVSSEPVPLLDRTAVLAQLQQAKALERIAANDWAIYESLHRIAEILEQIRDKIRLK